MAYLCFLACGLLFFLLLELTTVGRVPVSCVGTTLPRFIHSIVPMPDTQPGLEWPSCLDGPAVSGRTPLLTGPPHEGRGIMSILCFATLPRPWLLKSHRAA